MSDWKGETVLKAVQTALETASYALPGGTLTKPSGLTVERHPERPIEHARLPQQDIWLRGGRPGLDITSAIRWDLEIAVRSTVAWADADASSGDEALGPLMTWAHAAMCQDETLGGASLMVEPTGFRTPEVEERTEKYAQVVQTFLVTVDTLYGDLRSGPDD